VNLGTAVMVFNRCQR